MQINRTYNYRMYPKHSGKHITLTSWLFIPKIPESVFSGWCVTRLPLGDVNAPRPEILWMAPGGAETQ